MSEDVRTRAALFNRPLRPWRGRAGPEVNDPSQRHETFRDLSRSARMRRRMIGERIRMKLHATLAAAAAFAAAFVAAGAVSPAQAASVDGKAAYAELCASCHKTPQRLVARMDLSPAGVKKLDEFLVGHYAKDDAKRKAVIEFLASLK